MTTAIYTATASNAGFYMVLAVEAHSGEDAARLFAGFLDESRSGEDEEHEMALALDPDADRADSTYSLGHLAETDELEGVGRTVEMLSSGANG